MYEELWGPASGERVMRDVRGRRCGHGQRQAIKCSFKVVGCGVRAARSSPERTFDMHNPRNCRQIVALLQPDICACMVALLQSMYRSEWVRDVCYDGKMGVNGQRDAH